MEQLVVMLFGIFSRCDSMGEVCNGMRALAGKLNYLGVNSAPSKSTAGDALRDRNNEIFKLYYFALIKYSEALLSVSRKEKISFEKFYAFDSTTITLFSDVMKAFSIVAALIRIHLISHLDLMWIVTEGRSAYIKRTASQNKSPAAVQMSLF